MESEQCFSVVIVAGGKGLRAGGKIPKQFRELALKPMLMRTIEAFHNFSSTIRIIVVLPEGFSQTWTNLCQKHNFTIKHNIVTGGETRFHSVKNGLAKIPNSDIVGIHDAARPFVSQKVIARCFHEAMYSGCGVIPVVEEKNSVRILTQKGSEVIDRSKIRVVQTPQVFPAGLLKKAYETPYQEQFTDDASVAENNGLEIRLVEGEDENIKITTSSDLVFAAFVLTNLH